MRPNTSSQRPVSRGRKRLDDLKPKEPANDEAPVEELNIRVQGRNTSAAPKGILDTLRESVVSRGPDQKIDFKDTLKRPLTGGRSFLPFVRILPFVLQDCSVGTKPQPNVQQQQIQQAAALTLAAQNQQQQFQETADFDADADDAHDYPTGPHSAMDDNASVLNLNPNNHYGLDGIDFAGVDFGKFDDIDISCLARLVCVQSEVVDEEEPWSWDSMFASVSSEMREEWAQEDEEGDTTEIVTGLNSI
ncbi:hypothetical protein M3Y99_01629900 [Aphelenchoides fujianensis]|nr:hypothetical protein M3Y99_01629900 [Aphelenchoides fujianensis]